MVVVATIAAWSYKSRGERERIARLALHLRQYDIEKLMESLSEGYLRALGEEDAQRRQAIWTLLEPAERKISEQFKDFALRFGQESEEHSRVMRPDWPSASVLQLLGRFFPNLLARQSFDMRRLLALHAQAIARAAHATGLSAPDKAYTLLAELMLMQHSCHWYCKSRNVASARLLLRHQTPHQKVLASVAPETRQEYEAITGV